MTRNQFPASSERFPALFRTSTILLTVVVLGWFGWNAYYSVDVIHKLRAGTFRIQELQGRITHLDEVLTMSARMAAATGDLQWEQRYRDFEPHLEQAIKDMVRLVPAIYSEDGAAETNAANLRLIGMEHRAFDLVRQGRPAEALALLSSSEYEAQKKIYSAGMAKVSIVARMNADKSLAAEEQRAQYNRIAVLVTLPGLLVGWVMLLRTLCNWRVRQEETNRQLTRQAQDLLEVNTMLDDRVTTRTSALLKSEERYRELFENASEIIFTTDLEGNFTSVNKAGESKLGYSHEEFLTLNQDQIIAPESREEIRQYVAGLLAGSRPRAKEVQVVTKDGQRVPMEGTGRLIYEDEKPVGVQVIIRDLTERKQVRKEREMAEKVLRESEEQFSKVFHNSPISISLSTVSEGRFIDVNESFLQITGYNRDRVIGRTPLELGFWKESETIERLIQELRQGQSVKNLRSHFRRSDGRLRSVSLAAELVELHGEECLLLFSQDVTETEVLQEQLQQTSKMEAVGRLAGGIAHDFNNLLMVINWYSDLLLTHMSQDDPQRRNAEEIRKSGSRAAALTGQLLAFGRKQLLQPSNVNINTLLGNLENMVRPLVGEDIELLTRMDPVLGQVYADPHQLEQVIVNLVANARDSMTHGGKLFLETNNVELDGFYQVQHTNVTPGPYVCVTVTDTGRGIDRETQSHIFEPFFTTKEKGKGTGLGLATVYGIVKQSNGYIWCYSEVGQGTTFKIYLPRVDVPADPPAREPASPAGHFHGKKTVLVVEDTEQVRELVVALLADNGFRVLQASSGKEALQIVSKHAAPIDLLLSDVIMPGMSGPKLAEQIVCLRPGIRTVFMSGYTDGHISQGGMPDTGLLFKPFTKAALLGALREALERIPIAGLVVS